MENRPENDNMIIDAKGPALLLPICLMQEEAQHHAITQQIALLLMLIAWAPLRHHISSLFPPMTHWQI